MIQTKVTCDRSFRDSSRHGVIRLAARILGKKRYEVHCTPTEYEQLTTYAANLAIELSRPGLAEAIKVVAASGDSRGPSALRALGLELDPADHLAGKLDCDEATAELRPVAPELPVAETPPHPPIVSEPHLALGQTITNEALPQTHGDSAAETGRDRTELSTQEIQDDQMELGFDAL